MAHWIGKRGPKKFRYHLPVEIVNEKTPETWTKRLFPMKKIVVVIPAYHAAETLPGVLARIPKTTYNTLERILIVEDGGADVACSTSPELLKCYPKIDVLFHEHNKGYGAARKDGIQTGTGNWR